MPPLTCFAVSPAGVRFETQEKDEHIILFLRQHPIIFAPAALIVILLIIAPILVFPFLKDFLPFAGSLPAGYAIVGSVFWYLVTFGFAIVNFLRWYFNIYVVTNERIVDIDFIHLLYKEFSEAQLTNVQDISYKRAGIFASLFNFGNVFVQTAGTFPNFEFLAVPRPSQVITIISELIEEARR